MQLNRAGRAEGKLGTRRAKSAAFWRDERWIERWLPWVLFAGALSFAAGLVFTVLEIRDTNTSWADLAGAWMGGSAGLFAGATFLYLVVQVRIAGQESELNVWSARLQAYTVRADAARARVETLLKGSELPFEKQEFDARDFEHIRQRLSDQILDRARWEIIEMALTDWHKRKVHLDRVIEEFDEKFLPSGGDGPAHTS